MYELIIFDCDGVLIDSEWLGHQVETEELNRLGCPISYEDYLDMALGTTCEEVEEKLLTEHGFSIPEGFWEKMEERLAEEFTKSLTPILGVKELIQNLTVPYCVASSSHHARLNHTLSLTGLFPFLTGRIFGRECVKKGKPNPDIFLYAGAQMHTPPSKCLVIEDSLHGVHAAQAAGMDVWGFCGGKHYTETRKEQLRKSGVNGVYNEMKMIQNQIAKLYK